MRLHLRIGRRDLVLATVIGAGLLAPLRASADVITIDDGAAPGQTRIPFTCSLDDDINLWRPYMGFAYRNVEPFELSPGDTIAFDIEMPAGGPADLGFQPQLDIALAHAPDAVDPFLPANLPGPSDFTVVANDAIAASAGNQIAGDYELVFTADARFSFPGGGLIIRVSDPQGALATKLPGDCQTVITADRQPSGTNRLVGTFKLDDDGEHPWMNQNTIATPEVPYVRITWTRCGDGLVTGAEQCDDANADDLDDCSNACLAPACGDGIVQRVEQCDNSANPDSPDPFCDDSTCRLTAIAKGSGCDAGGGAGALAALGAMMFLVLVRRRRVAS